MTRKLVLIIQSRMGSKRLSGKSIMNIAGKSLLHRILERVAQVKKVDETVLAIPSTKENKILQNISFENGIKVFPRQEENLLGRFYKALQLHGAEVVGLLSADNAAPEPMEIDRIITSHLSLNKPSFSSNLCQILKPGYLELY